MKPSNHLIIYNTPLPHYYGMSAGPAVREVTQKEHWTYPEGFGLASGEPDVRRVRHANMRPGFPYPHFTSQSL